MSTSREKYITSIRDVPVCNQRLCQEVAILTKTPVALVEEITQFLGEYTAAVIELGVMQSVRLPYLGKFAPKPSKLRALKRREREKASGMAELKRAIRTAKPKPDAP